MAVYKQNVREFFKDYIFVRSFNLLLHEKICALHATNGFDFDILWLTRGN